MQKINNSKTKKKKKIKPCGKQNQKKKTPKKSQDIRRENSANQAFVELFLTPAEQSYTTLIVWAVGQNAPVTHEGKDVVGIDFSPQWILYKYSDQNSVKKQFVCRRAWLGSSENRHFLKLN